MKIIRRWGEEEEWGTRILQRISGEVKAYFPRSKHLYSTSFREIDHDFRVGFRDKLGRRLDLSVRCTAERDRARCEVSLFIPHPSGSEIKEITRYAETFTRFYGLGRCSVHTGLLLEAGASIICVVPHDRVEDVIADLAKIARKIKRGELHV